MKKRTIAFLLVFVLAFSAFSLGAFADARAQGIFYTAKENVNIRSGPGTNYTPIGVLNGGEMMGFSSHLNLSSPTWAFGYPAEGTKIYDHYMEEQGWRVEGYVYTSYLRA